MSDQVLKLGHKPNEKEIETCFKAILKAGTETLNKGYEQLEKANAQEDSDSALIRLSLAFSLVNTTKLIKKFIETGVLENPIKNDDNTEFAHRIEDIQTKKNKVEDKDEAEELDSDENVMKIKFSESKMSQDEVEDIYNIIDHRYKQAGAEVLKKYGEDDTIKGLIAYAKSFVQMANKWKENKEENKDEETVEIKIIKTNEKLVNDFKENGEECSIEEVYKYMEERGDTKTIARLKKLLKENGGENGIITVYRRRIK